MAHWIHTVLAWHAANVAGNMVASLEMGILLLAVGRPLLRRLRNHLTADLREHVTAQVQQHVSGIHRRLDTMALRVLDTDNTQPPGEVP